MVVMSVAIGERRDGGEYVDIGGNPIWHLHTGNPAGPATVLLHSVFSTSAAWAAQILDFGDAGLNLYVPERTGHGHSPDVDGPYTFAGTTEQIITYLETVVGKPANLVGWGDSTCVALLVAQTRPDLVRKLVLTCGYVNSDSVDLDEFLRPLARREPIVVDLLEDLYKQFSPDGPEHFETYLAKAVDLMLPGPAYSTAEFTDVEAPVLIVASDTCGIDVGHGLELARTLPRGRFAVLPGTHLLPAESPELFNPLVLSFLAADPPSDVTYINELARSAHDEL
ncbi:MAG: alpha/beta hydrolase [Gordonia amarae]